jgi:hypothetical protein
MPPPTTTMRAVVFMPTQGPRKDRERGLSLSACPHGHHKWLAPGSSACSVARFPASRRSVQTRSVRLCTRAPQFPAACVQRGISKEHRDMRRPSLFGGAARSWLTLQFVHDPHVAPTQDGSTARRCRRRFHPGMRTARARTPSRTGRTDRPRFSGAAASQI